ncbi:hypothetical protein KKC08_00455 [Patescibacteria group bacterium]|nr:hypothetical protein [Patescibacteria group bacterium]MCG2702276.1 hypothetical protein [Candidatus Parcubacteria bacterium]MBU4264710.1 hypothetical protein [Patescibacteria group bacterium]MBU4390048.1 hypothetical protein [Patescibacteria group bacterium]MBU4396626.1 hypothetical protein [Patescibacteria group bacterium]
MYDWSTDTTRLIKDKDAWEKWKLEQMINFGLNGKKLSKLKLKKYWDELDIDPDKRNYLKFLLWEDPNY